MFISDLDDDDRDVGDGAFGVVAAVGSSVVDSVVVDDESFRSSKHTQLFNQKNYSAVKTFQIYLIFFVNRSNRCQCEFFFDILIRVSHCLI